MFNVVLCNVLMCNALQLTAMFWCAMFCSQVQCSMFWCVISAGNARLSSNDQSGTKSQKSKQTNHQQDWFMILSHSRENQNRQTTDNIDLWHCLLLEKIVKDLNLDLHITMWQHRNLIYACMTLLVILKCCLSKSQVSQSFGTTKSQQE